MLERSSVCNAVLGAGANINIMFYYAITRDYIFTKNFFSDQPGLYHLLHVESCIAKCSEWDTEDKQSIAVKVGLHMNLSVFVLVQPATSFPPSYINHSLQQQPLKPINSRSDQLSRHSLSYRNQTKHGSNFVRC